MNFDWIEQNVLAAGSAPQSMDDVNILRDAGIKMIMTLTEQRLDLDESHDDRVPIIAYHHAIPDGQPPRLSQALLICEFILAGGRQKMPVYLHCREGVGRTGTLLHFYYWADRGNLDEAKAEIAKRRPQNAWANLTESQRQWLTKVAEL